MKILSCRIGQPPTIEDLPDTLEAMQAFVGGYIERVHLPGTEFSFYCNEGDSASGLPANRSVLLYGGSAYCVHGNFFFVHEKRTEKGVVVRPMTKSDAKTIEELLRPSQCGVAVADVVERVLGTFGIKMAVPKKEDMN